ncbi:MAG: prolyl oligopeptidase family serine peptidase, partial [Ardenticatenales bacterium]
LIASPTNTTRHYFIADLATPNAEPTKVYAGNAYPSGVVYNGGTLVGTFLDITDPGELRYGVWDEAKGPVTTLNTVTDLNAGPRDAAGLAYEVVAYTTSAGVSVEGLYVYPKNWTLTPPTARPMIVWQAGGPGGQMTNTWGTSVESPYSMLPSYGIPVFVVNGSGRTSNGAAFYSAMADDRNYGQRDIRDVKEGVDALIAKGYVDPKAVGVTGCSYGGYFTLQSIAELPGYYAAANAQCSLNDMMYEFNFGWSPFLAYLIGNSPTGDPQEFVRDSPTYNMGKVTTPLLLFHGTYDFLFFETITNIHDQLTLRGVPARYFRGIGYGHGIGNIQGVPNSGAKGQRAAFQLQLEWFRQYLPGAASPSLFRSIQDRLRPMLPPIIGRPAPSTGEVR